MYVDADGVPVPGATLRGGKAAGIPGVPAGMVHLAQRYGKLRLRQLLAPAIALARNGFNLDSRFARIAKVREPLLREGVNSTTTRRHRKAICCVSRNLRRRSSAWPSRGAMVFTAGRLRRRS